MSKINGCKQNVKYKPFKWADLTLIIQFDFCPKCRYFESCYELSEVAQRYDGRAITIKGESHYISADCGNDLESELE